MSDLAADALAEEDFDTDRLAIRLQAGEQEPFKALFERYFDRVYTHLRIALHDVEQAEEATQEVFVRVLEDVSDYEPGWGQFRAWLFRLARAAADERRFQSERSPVERSAHSAQSAESAGARPTPVAEVGDAKLLDLIEWLPPDEQLMIFLRYLFGMGGREPGGALEEGPEYSEEFHHRALATLRTRLDPLEDQFAQG